MCVVFKDVWWCERSDCVVKGCVMVCGMCVMVMWGMMVDEMCVKLCGVKDVLMKCVKLVIECVRMMMKCVVEMVKILDVGVCVWWVLGVDVWVVIGYCVVGMLAAAATARGVVGGLVKMNVFVVVLVRCVVEIKIGVYWGLVFVDWYFVVLVKYLSERVGALRTTSSSEVKAKAMLDVIIVFVFLGVVVMYVKMILIIIVFFVIVCVVFYRLMCWCEVKVVFVTGGSGGFGSLLLEGICIEFLNVIVYGILCVGVSSKKFGC